VAYHRGVDATRRLRAGFGSGAGALLRVAVIALATHAVVYRSLLPADGLHGYFGWYAPLLAGLSAAALLGTLGVLVARVCGVGSSWVPRVSALPQPSQSVTVATSRLAAKAVAFLVVQETLERSLPSHSFELAQFTPLYWVVVLAAASLGAFILVSARRGSVLLARHLDRRHPPATASRPLRAAPPRRVAVGARNPLASFRGLRAPPSLLHV
jgi:hypothetical protein